jgi:hypothetical protein
MERGNNAIKHETYQIYQMYLSSGAEHKVLHINIAESSAIYYVCEMMMIAKWSAITAWQLSGKINWVAQIFHQSVAQCWCAFHFAIFHTHTQNQHLFIESMTICKNFLCSYPPRINNESKRRKKGWKRLEVEWDGRVLFNVKCLLSWNLKIEKRVEWKKRACTEEFIYQWYKKSNNRISLYQVSFLNPPAVNLFCFRST